MLAARVQVEQFAGADAWLALALAKARAHELHRLLSLNRHLDAINGHFDLAPFQFHGQALAQLPAFCLCLQQPVPELPGNLLAMPLIEMREWPVFSSLRAPVMLKEFSNLLLAYRLARACHAFNQRLERFVCSLPEREEAAFVAPEMVDRAVGIATRARLVLLDLPGGELRRLHGLNKSLARL